MERDDPRVVTGAEAFRSRGRRIPEIRLRECARTISGRPVAYDSTVGPASDEAAAPHRCVEHPEHQAGAGRWREFATWVIADHVFRAFAPAAARHDSGGFPAFPAPLPPQHGICGACTQ